MNTETTETGKSFVRDVSINGEPGYEIGISPHESAIHALDMIMHTRQIFDNAVKTHGTNGVIPAINKAALEIANVLNTSARGNADAYILGLIVVLGGIGKGSEYRAQEQHVADQANASGAKA